MLSKTVAAALLVNGRDEVTPTATFVEMFNKFFDCMNVSTLSKGKL